MATIFTKIIDWDIPAYKIYENEYVLAFLDIYPKKPGHTIIIPKIEVDHFSDIPEPYYSEIFIAAKKVSKALLEASGCKRVCTTFLGYEIPHAHYHLVPTESEKDMCLSGEKASEESLKAMQQKIVSHL